MPAPAWAGLASVQASNGHILALATSEQWSQSQLDYAYQASRQTGSAFKVFALMTLIHDYDGNPNDTYYTSRPLPPDGRRWRPTWSVHTDDYKYNGSINITQATAISDNTVFAQLVVDLGVDKMNQIARAMGITSPLASNPSEVLGGAHLRDDATADGRRLRDDRRRRHPSQADDHRQDRVPRRPRR